MCVTGASADTWGELTTRSSPARRTMAQIKGKAIKNGKNKIMSTHVKLGIFNSQIVQHYITNSVFKNFVYMRS